MTPNILISRLNKWQINLFRSCLLISAFMLISCSSDSGSTGGSGTKSTTPTNLVVSALVIGTSVQNPNGDGSGMVNFNISATNATSYKILLGNGEVKEVTNGVFTYTYTASGTNTYVVYVSAYNGANFISTSASISLYVAPTALWSDEFNVAGTPNSNYWSYDTGAGGWGNNEAQYYTNRPENISVSNGTLKINTIKESYLGSNYTSARIITKGKFSFKYGTVEIKAKMPIGGGTWPALWMLGSNIDTAPWPACGEIDMMEHLGNQLNKIYGTLHYPGHYGGTGDSSNVTITNATTEFHIYKLDWRADFVKFYVDNQLFKTFVNSASLPFNQNFFLIINSAIGGNFGGTIDPNFVSSTFEIDYVRVYN
ncbi:glycoside hydrolase family 16 protein [Flavobacterium soyangense]|uniref:Glycoside hydrolase family 16 protein n=1 Tax=Flavobacterium soyangense TaxID=2023265 RepID=A0A930UAL8_9FLAO|nr:glycoside hydrolase family 16 protein [Flavobacterium soyangense]MBF2708592.1 glycoside hydrolase family 16 protein [Flavobacterium soyangense]